MGRGRDRASGSRAAGGLTWAITSAVVVIAVVAAGLGIVVLTQDDAMAGAGHIAASDASAQGAQQATSSRIVIIGDSYTGGSPMDSGPEARWTTLLDELPQYAVTTLHEGGTGYVATRASVPESSTFVDRAADVPADADLIVFFGSINDRRHGYHEIHFAAVQALQTAADVAPGVPILVIGPASPWPTLDGVTRARDATRDAAIGVGAEFVDPLEQGWFEDDPGLIGADGVHPNDRGQTYLFERIESTVVDALTTD